MNVKPRGGFYELVYVWQSGLAEVRDRRPVKDIAVAKNHLRFCRLARKLTKLNGKRRYNPWFIRRVE